MYFILGLLLGSSALYIVNRLQRGSVQQIAQVILATADSEAKHKIALAELEIEHLRKDMKRGIEEQQRAVVERSEELKSQAKLLEKKISEATIREAQLQKKERALEERSEELTRAMEKLASLSEEEAKGEIIRTIEQEMQSEIAKRRAALEENADREAARTITTAINRLAASTVSEHTVNTVSVPSDDLKARIIGREGRNIRCLEKETGVNFLVDDTPGAIVLSCFDPIRLHVAKLALQDLILDGRIHPSRIEEAVLKAQKRIVTESQLRAEDAAMQAGVLNLHPELLALLGKLAYRYSLGQNVLTHSVEVSHLMGMMAAELNLDVRLAKRIGLLHDIGKAASQELEGSHALIGFQLTQKYGENIKVSNGIGCHHNEIEPITVEGSLCGAADALSAARPGARLDAVENYLLRLQNLEKIAMEFPGVEKVYALQAGKEVRVTVLPDLLDDEGAKALAGEITRRIETELKFHGKIKVTLIREKRITAYAI